MAVNGTWGIDSGFSGLRVYMALQLKGWRAGLPRLRLFRFLVDVGLKLPGLYKPRIRVWCSRLTGLAWDQTQAGSGFLA